MKLDSGVLQGGGTGPRVFRQAFDECVAAWQDDPANTAQDIAVQYNDHQYRPSVAAYADDLVRVTTGTTLHDLQFCTETQQKALQDLLRPRGLCLNENVKRCCMSVGKALTLQHARLFLETGPVSH